MHTRPVLNVVQLTHAPLAVCIPMTNTYTAFAHPLCTRKANWQLQLGTMRTELLDRLRAENLPWTDLMDRAMAAAHEEQGASAADVQAACA